MVSELERCGKKISAEEVAATKIPFLSQQQEEKCLLRVNENKCLNSKCNK